MKLGAKHGPAAWKAHNARTEALIKNCDRQLHEAEKRIQQTGQRRKLQQERAQADLARLQSEYKELVTKNIAIELECRKMEAQLHAAESGPEQAGAGASNAQQPANGVLHAAADEAAGDTAVHGQMSVDGDE